MERDDMKTVQWSKDWEEMKLKRESGASMEDPILRYGFYPTGSGRPLKNFKQKSNMITLLF